MAVCVIAPSSPNRWIVLMLWVGVGKMKDCAFLLRRKEDVNTAKFGFLLKVSGKMRRFPGKAAGLTLAEHGGISGIKKSIMFCGKEGHNSALFVCW
jgi:hypothetical protein